MTAFLRCAAECAQQGISPIFFQCTEHQIIYVSCLFTDTDKQEKKNTLRWQHLQKTKDKEFQIIVLCSVSVGLLTNNDSRSGPTTHATEQRAPIESIWNNSLVTKSVLIFINLQTTGTSLVFVSIHFWQYIQLNLSPLSGVWNWTDDSNRAGNGFTWQYQQTTRRARLHEL